MKNLKRMFQGLKVGDLLVGENRKGDFLVVEERRNKGKRFVFLDKEGNFSHSLPVVFFWNDEEGVPMSTYGDPLQLAESMVLKKRHLVGLARSLASFACTDDYENFFEKTHVSKATAKEVEKIGKIFDDAMKSDAGEEETLYAACVAAGLDPKSDKRLTALLLAYGNHMEQIERYVKNAQALSTAQAERANLATKESGGYIH